MRPGQARSPTVAYNPFTFMSDKDRVSPYNIKQTSIGNKENHI